MRMIMLMMMKNSEEDADDHDHDDDDDEDDDDNNDDDDVDDDEEEEDKLKGIKRLQRCSATCLWLMIYIVPTAGYCDSYLSPSLCASTVYRG